MPETAAVFLSTLAGITATVLAILTAAIGTYSVFLQERRAAYDERIAQTTLELRELLLQMRNQWHWHYEHLPPEFGDMYRARFPDAFGHVFINRAIRNLISDESEVKSVLADIQELSEYSADPTGGDNAGTRSR